ncbi:MAG: hypothetical protein NXI04_21580 [Planctomycetaceae bacterium]|nr:hypothetical protein [Planctomycetaceae bacterium]
MPSPDDPDSTEIMKPCLECRRRLERLAAEQRTGFRVGHYVQGRCDRCAARDPSPECPPDASPDRPA